MIGLPLVTPQACYKDKYSLLSALIVLTSEMFAVLEFRAQKAARSEFSVSFGKQSCFASAICSVDKV